MTLFPGERSALDTLVAEIARQAPALNSRDHLSIAVALQVARHPDLLTYAREGRAFYRSRSREEIIAHLNGQNVITDTLGDSMAQQRFNRLGGYLQSLRESGFAREANEVSDRLITALFPST